MAMELCRDGARMVIAIGGDGTINETASGLVRVAAEHGIEAELGIIPSGTGSDLARTLQLEAEPEAAFARIMAGGTRTIDVGRVSYVDEAGEPARRHFINIASLGLSGPTARAVNGAKRSARTSGKLTFMVHIVRELLRYRFQDVVITVDEQVPVTARIAVVAIANGRCFAGGMKIAPDAEPDDGWFDVVIFRGASKLRLIFDMKKIYSGTHVTLAGVTVLRGRKIEVEPVGGSDGPNVALLDIDGESPGSIPATFEVLPHAVQVRL
jgi:YegS/Rv2252/BmrU family lipid kinase